MCVCVCVSKSLTWVDPEETCGAAKVLPGERRVLQEVVHKDVIQCLRVVNGVQDVWVCKHKARTHTHIDRWSQRLRTNTGAGGVVSRNWALTSDLCCRRWWVPARRSAACWQASYWSAHSPPGGSLRPARGCCHLRLPCWSAWHCSSQTGYGWGEFSNPIKKTKQKKISLV